MKGRHGRLAALLLAGVVASLPARASQYRSSPVPVGLGSSAEDARRVIRSCIEAAANAHGLPPAMLVILLRVEGGRLGRVSDNANATVDIGPMQVNEIWLPKLAARWGASIPDTFVALRDNFCANLEGGAWILRQGLDEARGDFWQGVSYYHSHAPEHKATYLRKVLQHALRLDAQAGRAVPAPASAAAVPAPATSSPAARTTLAGKD
jgi:hypothetical protein